jgi:hypothetical protein
VVAFTVRASCLEIYQEAIYDLLSDSGARTAKNVTIRDNDRGEQVVAGLAEVPVASPAEAGAVLARGLAARATGSTNMNARSSRSHAIFTLTVEQTVALGGGDGLAGSSGASSSAPSASAPLLLSKRTSRIHLVDLAGSERAGKTGAEGTRLREAAAINRGLLALGNVINALAGQEEEAAAAAGAAGAGAASSTGSEGSAGASSSAAGGTHIPYRDSKLTRLLKSSLGGCAHTLMIACCSPADSNIEESLSTLRYASRARAITNRVAVNVDPVSQQLAALRRQVQELQAALVEARGGSEAAAGATGAAPSASQHNGPGAAQIAGGAGAPAVSALQGAAAAELTARVERMEGERTGLRQAAAALRRELAACQHDYQSLTLTQMWGEREKGQLAGKLGQLMDACAEALQAAAAGTRAAASGGVGRVGGDPFASLRQVLQCLRGDPQVSAALALARARSSRGGAAGRTGAGTLPRIDEGEGAGGEGEEEEEEDEEELLAALEAQAEEEAEGGAGASGGDGGEWGDVDIADLELDWVVSQYAAELQEQAQRDGGTELRGGAASAAGAVLLGAAAAADSSAPAAGEGGEAAVPSGSSGSRLFKADPGAADATGLGAMALASGRGVDDATDHGSSRQPLQLVSSGSVNSTATAASRNGKSAAPGASSAAPAALQAAATARDRASADDGRRRQQLVQVNRRLQEAEAQLRTLEQQRCLTRQLSAAAATVCGPSGERESALDLEADSSSGACSIRAALRFSDSAFVRGEAGSEDAAPAAAAAAEAAALQAQIASMAAEREGLQRQIAALTQAQQRPRGLAAAVAAAAPAAAATASAAQLAALQSALAAKDAELCRTRDALQQRLRLSELAAAKATRSAAVAAEVAALRCERAAVLRGMREEAGKARRARGEAAQALRRAAAAEHKAGRAALELERRGREVEALRHTERRRAEEVLRLKRQVQEAERRKRAGLMGLLLGGGGGPGAAGAAAGSAMASGHPPAAPGAAAGSLFGGMLPSTSPSASLSTVGASELLADLLGSVAPAALAAARVSAGQASGSVGDSAGGTGCPLPRPFAASAQLAALGSVEAVSGARFLLAMSQAAAGSLAGTRDVAFSTAADRQSSKLLQGGGYTTSAALRAYLPAPALASAGAGAVLGAGAALSTGEARDSAADIFPSQAGSAGSVEAGGDEAAAADPLDLSQPRPTDSLVCLADCLHGAPGHGELPLELRRKLEGYVAARSALRRAKTRMAELVQGRATLSAALAAAAVPCSSLPSAEMQRALRRRRDVMSREVAACNDAIICLTAQLEELQQAAGAAGGSREGRASRKRGAHWLTPALLAGGNDRRAIQWLANVAVRLSAACDTALHELAVARACTSQLAARTAVAIASQQSAAAEAQRSLRREVRSLEAQSLFLLTQLSRGTPGVAAGEGAAPGGGSGSCAVISGELLKRAEAAHAEAAAALAAAEASASDRLRAEAEALAARAACAELQREVDAMAAALEIKASAAAPAPSAATSTSAAAALLSAGARAASSVSIAAGATGADAGNSGSAPVRAEGAAAGDDGEGDGFDLVLAPAPFGDPAAGVQADRIGRNSNGGSVAGGVRGRKQTVGLAAAGGGHASAAMAMDCAADNGDDAAVGGSDSEVASAAGQLEAEGGEDGDVEGDAEHEYWAALAEEEEGGQSDSDEDDSEYEEQEEGGRRRGRQRGRGKAAGKGHRAASDGAGSRRGRGPRKAAVGAEAGSDDDADGEGQEEGAPAPPTAAGASRPRKGRAPAGAAGKRGSKTTGAHVPGAAAEAGSEQDDVADATAAVAPPVKRKRTAALSAEAAEGVAAPEGEGSCPCAGKCATKRCPCRAGGLTCGSACACKACYNRKDVLGPAGERGESKDAKQAAGAGAAERASASDAAPEAANLATAIASTGAVPRPAAVAAASAATTTTMAGLESSSSAPEDLDIFPAEAEEAESTGPAPGPVRAGLSGTARVAGTVRLGLAPGGRPLGLAAARPPAPPSSAAARLAGAATSSGGASVAARQQLVGAVSSSAAPVASSSGPSISGTSDGGAPAQITGVKRPRTFGIAVVPAGPAPSGPASATLTAGVQPTASTGSGLPAPGPAVVRSGLPSASASLGTSGGITSGGLPKRPPFSSVAHGTALNPSRPAPAAIVVGVKPPTLPTMAGPKPSAGMLPGGLRVTAGLTSTGSGTSTVTAGGAPPAAAKPAGSAGASSVVLGSGRPLFATMR